MEHTLEKWETHPVTEFNVVYAVIDGEAQEICRTPGIWPNDKANARRIVACVNACEGIETETLQGFEGAEFNQVLKLCQQIDTVTKQNARLLEALKGYESHITKNFPWDLSEPLNTIHKAARAAIAEAENTEPPHTRATII